MSVLKIYDDNTSQWIEIPSIKGDIGPEGPQGPQGDPGIYVGSAAPTDPNINMWFDTDETSEPVVTSVNGQSGAVNLLNLIYPIGSIYMSVNSTSPSTLFGGTWERIQDMFLLAAGSTYAAGSTGGEATHTLSVNEMPSHNHDIYYRAVYRADAGAWSIDPGTKGTANSGANAIQNAGGGQAHNNMPPYLAVYVWKRTA